MAISQINLNTEEQANIGGRTLWQKAEYERRRVGYRKEFKNLCLQHIQLLKRKEGLIDFGRLFNVWQVYIQYKKLEAKAVLQYIETQTKEWSQTQQNNMNPIAAMLVKTDIYQQELLVGVNLLIDLVAAKSKHSNANLDLLDRQIADVKHDLEEVKNKNAVIYESFVQFSNECPDQPELTEKDFVNVVQEDFPQIAIDKTISSKLAEQIKLNLLNCAHKSELKIELVNGSMQKLELIELTAILELNRSKVWQQKTAGEKFSEYLAAKQAILASVIETTELQIIQTELKNHVDAEQAEYAVIELNLAIATSHFDYGMLQVALYNEQEIAELNTFDYRAFKQQEAVFKKNCKRNQAEDADTRTELARKIAEIREPKANRQQKIRLDFKRSRMVIQHNINQGKTAAEIEELKAKHVIKYVQDNHDDVLMISAEDEILPVPSTPAPARFNLGPQRNEVIIAIAQTVCESLAVLAMAASPRVTLKTPQEIAGILDFHDPEKIAILDQHTKAEDQAIEDLGSARTKICKLGEEVNQLIKGLE